MTDPLTPPADTAPPAPFDSQRTFTVTKAINLEQLTSEIQGAVKTEASVAQSGPANGNEAVSANNPLTLAVTPASVDQTKVQAAIDAHVPDAQFGVPQTVKDFNDTLAKVVNDPSYKMTANELQAAVRGLLLRVATTPAPGADLLMGQ